MNDTTTIRVPLTKGYFTVIDEADREILTVKLQVVIYKTSGPYASKTMMTSNGHKPVKLHRIIMERVLGRPLLATEQVDHIDGNGLNNCRSNLRLSTKATNAANAKRRSDNNSGYKGVCWSKPSQRWRAYIRPMGKQIHLGLFDTPEEAHEAYKKAAVELYGEFARFE